MSAPAGNEMPLMAGPPPQQHQMPPSFQRRSPAAPTYVQAQDLKAAAPYATVSGVSEFPFKNGTVMPGRGN